MAMELRLRPGQLLPRTRAPARGLAAPHLAALPDCWDTGVHSRAAAPAPSGVLAAASVVAASRCFWTAARRPGRRRRRAQRRAVGSPAPPAPALEVQAPGVGAAVGRWWSWRGHRVRYVVLGEGPPVLLVHGFGASADYFRKLLPAVAAEGYSAYAVDLLGLGLSEKPTEEDYSIALWAEQVQDFCSQALPEGQPPVLVGNSFGSLVALAVAASEWGRAGGVRALVLLNCAGGMNVRHMVTDDLTPQPLKAAAAVVTAVLNTLLGWRAFAAWFFDRVKTAENVSEVLKSIYTNKDAVDSELVRGVLAPAADSGALDVFVKILTGDPGPSPEKLMPSVRCPVKLVWGDTDTFTPVDGAYGKYFCELAETRDDVSFTVVEAGHCLHDDNAPAVHGAVMPWLAALPR